MRMCVRPLGDSDFEAVVDGIRAGLVQNPEVSVTSKDVIWQEIIAALNRRRCILDLAAERLESEGWNVSRDSAWRV